MPAINAVVDPSLRFLIIDQIYREILAWENVISVYDVLTRDKN